MNRPRTPIRLTLAAILLCWCGQAPAQEQNSAATLAAAPAPAKPAVSGIDLVVELARAGRQREALAEADRLIEKGSEDAYLRAQRGFLRRELNDPQGAADDFAGALAGEGLTSEQQRNVEAGLAEARVADAQAALDRAKDDLAKGDFASAADAAAKVLAGHPNSEPAMLIRLDALSGAKKKSQALAEADQFVPRAAANAALRAQRGFLRRELNDPQGASDDFAVALGGSGLTDDQRRNVKAALSEAQAAVRPAGEAVRRTRIKRARIKAPVQAAGARAPQADIGTLIARGNAPGWAYVQRGLERRKSDDLQGAVQDFDAALKRGDLDKPATANVRYARAEAQAALAEREGRPLVAEASYRELLQSEPQQADGWYKLGYLLMKQKRRIEGADALSKGLDIHPVATAYLDAANAYILANAPLASKEYRQGLDRWYAGDGSVSGRAATDLERIKNEVVQADASVQTSVSAGTISGRPLDAGGTNNSAGAETRMRFDGRYLPAIAGLEAFARGLTGKDATGERETETGVGLRYRPIPDLNFYIGGLVDHFFEPSSETEFVAIWGLGLGSDAYPYVGGWKPYWDFGTFGAWRTSDQRVLEDVHGNVGLLYELRSPIRGAIGPTVLAVAGYDNQAATQWAAGIGPSILSYIWFGGDKYRSYDALVTLQVGYIFSVGNDERQSGWRAQIGVTF